MSAGHQRLAAVLAAAEPDDGIFHVEHAAAHGLTPSVIARLVQDGVLERIAPRYLRAAHLTWSLSARQRQALVRVGYGSVLGARSALHNWNLGPQPEQIEIITPRGLKREKTPIRIIQSTDLLPIDAEVHRQLDTSTPTRALIDAARFLSPLALEQAVSAALDKRLITLDQLEGRFQEVARRGRPGVQRMRACLSEFGCDPTATVFEKDLERIISRGGFPKPVRQYPVHTTGRTYFLDHAWPDHGKWSECDSMLAHGSAESLRKDLERQNRIIAATGFEPMRFTYFDVHQRPGYVTEILANHLPRSRP